MRTLPIVGLSVVALVVVLTAAASFSVSPAALTFSGSGSQTFTIKKGPGGFLKWTATPSQSWITVSPSAGSGPATVTVTTSASSLTAGTYTGVVNVKANTITNVVSVTMTVAPTPVPAPVPAPSPSPVPTTSGSLYGPSSAIGCPSGAVNVPAGASIQAAVNASPSGTTFCLLAGTFPLTASITPKSGDRFIGQFGAILDGSGWTTTDTTQAAFRAWNQDIDDVTIRNLVIRNMPQGGVVAFKDYSDRWTVDHTEIGPCGGTGVKMPNAFTAAYNDVHHCAIGGYSAYESTVGVFDHNEFAFNGNESKVTLTSGIAFTNNYVHDNVNGIWYDGDNTTCTITGNRVEHNQAAGIFIEISHGCIVQRNTLTGNGDQAVFVSNSDGLDLSGNTLAGNFRGIAFFQDCGRLSREPGHDLTNNSAHDNAVAVGTQPGALANFTNYANCTPDQLTAYAPGGSKNNRFSDHTYTVPSLSAAWWLWNGGLLTWAQWQALGQDVTGSITAQ